MIYLIEQLWWPFLLSSAIAGLAMGYLSARVG